MSYQLEVITEKLKRNLKSRMELKLTKLFASQSIDGRRLLSNVDISCELDPCMDAVILKFWTYAVEEKLEDVETCTTFYYPANWWEHFKRDCLPVWFQKWLPIKLESETRTMTCTLSALLIEKSHEYLDLGKQQRGHAVLHFNLTKSPIDEDFNDKTYQGNRKVN